MEEASSPLEAGLGPLSSVFRDCAPSLSLSPHPAGGLQGSRVRVGAPAWPQLGFTVEKLCNEHVTELGPREPLRRQFPAHQWPLWVTARGRDAAFSEVPGSSESLSQARGEAGPPRTGQGVSVKLLPLPTVLQPIGTRRPTGDPHSRTHRRPLPRHTDICPSSPTLRMD